MISFTYCVTNQYSKSFFFVCSKNNKKVIFLLVVATLVIGQHKLALTKNKQKKNAMTTSIILYFVL